MIVRNGEICISSPLTPYERLLKEAGPDAKMAPANRNFSWDRNEEEERIFNEQIGVYPE